MNDAQWHTLQAVIRGENVTPAPVAFIIDSPWLPNWAGVSILDYYASEERWLAANLKAIQEFPECLFLPGFWSEYGMCTEPSAFGAKCLFHDNEFPFAEKLIHTIDDVGQLRGPTRAATACCPSSSSGCSTPSPGSGRGTRHPVRRLARPPQYRRPS